MKIYICDRIGLSPAQKPARSLHGECGALAAAAVLLIKNGGLRF